MTPRKTTKDHGTVAAYRRHKRAGEKPCSRCSAAWSEYQRKYQAEYRQRTKGKKSAAKLQAVPSPAPTDAADAAVTASTGAVEPSNTLQAPRYLRERGQTLWDAITSTYEVSPGAAVSLAEACRIADRMERMSAALASGSTLWMELSDDDRDRAEDGGVPIVVNGMVSESRQLANQYNVLMRQLGLLDVAVVQEQTVSLTDQLAERRRQRLDREQAK